MTPGYGSCPTADSHPAGGGINSLLVRLLLTRIGLRDTLLTYFGINVLLLALAFPMLKSRGPARRVAKIEWVDTAMFKEPVFWSVGLCIFLVDL